MRKQFIPPRVLDTSGLYQIYATTIFPHFFFFFCRGLMPQCDKIFDFVMFKLPPTLLLSTLVSIYLSPSFQCKQTLKINVLSPPFSSMTRWYLLSWQPMSGCLSYQEPLVLFGVTCYTDRHLKARVIFSFIH